MKSVFMHHVPFRRYRGSQLSNFDISTCIGQLNGGLQPQYLAEFYLHTRSRLNRTPLIWISNPFLSITYHFEDTGGSQPSTFDISTCIGQLNGGLQPQYWSEF